QARQFNIDEEFALLGGVATTPVTLHSDTFGTLSRLEPGSAVNGVLYFDTRVPTSADPPLVLRWHYGGHSVELRVPLGGSPPTPPASHGTCRGPLATRTHLTPRPVEQRRKNRPNPDGGRHTAVHSPTDGRWPARRREAPRRRTGPAIADSNDR